LQVFIFGWIINLLQLSKLWSGVGGIVALIIFSIFLTQSAGEKMPAQKIGKKSFSALAAFCGFALVLLQLFQHSFIIGKDLTLTPKVADIGAQMLGVNEEWLCITI
jgi:NADH:ubiquinone oxidoreductase subunit 6 (subunit J)